MSALSRQQQRPAITVAVLIAHVTTIFTPELLESKDDEQVFIALEKFQGNYIKCAAEGAFDYSLLGVNCGDWWISGRNPEKRESIGVVFNESMQTLEWKLSEEYIMVCHIAPENDYGFGIVLQFGKRVGGHCDATSRIVLRHTNPRIIAQFVVTYLSPLFTELMMSD
jgi:hypothetical protein